LKTCPECKTSWYETYANGTTRVGYCQNCSLETKELTKDKDEIPYIVVSRPKTPVKNRFGDK
jgi:uncharacterized Zn finger protein (UPF0148 family)